MFDNRQIRPKMKANGEIQIEDIIRLTDEFRDKFPAMVGDDMTFEVTTVAISPSTVYTVKFTDGSNREFSPRREYIVPTSIKNNSGVFD